ncbi:hypothetical protein FSP39_023922 [Pinctada imbricata]|uniref:THAP-type domain-containing protein n=1 Tax=Pinctada imbricata TaxID=66713 RepID=A0AA88XC12_PINIB|nr:hypothetical protein FSP39_023922 [Pinctada imbricata]
MEDAPSSSKKRKKTPRGKGRYCVAYGCSSSSADNVPLYVFPRADKRSDIRKKWIAFVRNARKDFENPSAYMCLCEKHFEESCYPVKYRMMQSLGKGDEISKKILLPDAVPTIHLHKELQSQSGLGSHGAEPPPPPPLPPSLAHIHQFNRKIDLGRRLGNGNVLG